MTAARVQAERFGLLGLLIQDALSQQIFGAVSRLFNNS
jgi:hypothetical protein